MFLLRSVLTIDTRLSPFPSLCHQNKKRPIPHHRRPALETQSFAYPSFGIAVQAPRCSLLFKQV